MISKIFDRVLQIKLSGTIDSSTYKSLCEKLHFPTTRVKLVAVSINSSSGSQIQCINIKNKLHEFARKNGCPVFTFAEDLVFNSPNIILLSGHKVYANRFSLIGEFGYQSRWLGVKDWTSSHGIKMDTISAGENKLKLDPWQNFKAKDKVWLQTIQNENELQQKKEIVNLRSKQFKSKKMSEEDIDANIFGSKDLRANDQVDLGLIDAVGDFDEVKEHFYSGISVKRIHVPYFVNWGFGNISRMNNFEYVLSNRFLSQ